LAVEKELYSPLDGDSFGGTSAFRRRKEIYGRELTVIITDNPKLRKSQIDGVNDNILKCEKELFALQDNIKQREAGKIVKGRQRTALSVQNNVRQILSAEHMKKIFAINIFNIGDKVALTYNLDNDKYNDLIDNYLGKSILYTNRHDWTTEKIVATYRSQYHVEDTFKQIKDIKHLSFMPVRHFTDRMILVHAFYCVLGYTLTSLLQYEMGKLGYKMSINTVLEELSEAKQCLNVYAGNDKEKPRVVQAFSENSPAVESYLAEYDLKKYALTTL
jgi:transposase